MIRRGEFIDTPDDSGMIKMTIKKEAVHFVSPIYRYLAKEELNNLQKQTLPSFNSQFMCNYVLKFMQSGKVNCSQLLNFSGNSTNPIRFSEIKNDIQIRIDKALIHSLLEIL
jgi:hypothetical protein